MPLLWLAACVAEKAAKGKLLAGGGGGRRKQFLLLLEAAIWDAEVSVRDFYYLKVYWQALFKERNKKAYTKKKGVYKF